MPEIILPGTYITVRDEGLITAGRVATGNIGIVGTANKGPINEVQLLGTFAEALEIFGVKGAWIDGKSDELTLIRALEQVFNNGGQTVYAVRTASSSKAIAKIQLKDDSDADLFELSASSAGTWGNEISITIGDGDGGTKEVEISYADQKENYLVENASELAVQVNQTSALVSAEAASETGFTNKTFANTTTDTLLSGGNDGANAVAADYQTSLSKLEKDIVNIVLLAGESITSSDASMATVLNTHIINSSENKRERIGVLGCSDTTNVDDIVGARENISSDRLIFVGPGIKDLDGNVLPGAYAAASVVGLLSSIPVQTSLTNKVLNVPGLAEEYTLPKLEKLVQSKVLTIEKKSGFRVVKGITTSDNSAWHQITTRRIVDYAKYGVRSACNPYIGKLNNERVRSAMKATIDAFLTRMVEEEKLVSYELEVSATRRQEIAGEAIVIMTIRPTFSIDFVRVTMNLG